MFCSNCGKEIDDKAEFCYSCGTKIEKNVTDELYTDSIDNKSEEVLRGTTTDRTVNVNAYVNNGTEIACPYCGSSNIIRERRMGCLGTLGKIISGIILVSIASGLGITWLSTVSVIVFVIYFFYIDIQYVVNKNKPKWSYDIKCNSCEKRFVWDPTIKKII